MAGKGSMKNYRDLLNLEMKEHDYGERFFLFFRQLMQVA
jgi:hypothetical protein